MDAQQFPDGFLQKLRSVTAKRAKTVIDHILKHGHITTEELKNTYGYNHPPRAARDVREQGIPLEMVRVQGTDGRMIAAYRFGDPSLARGKTHAGRWAFSKQFKLDLIARDGARCAICSTPYEARYLQIDHRIPYEVAGDARTEPDIADFMLICGSCNRAKSWSCEHCPNGVKDKKPAVCATCYWAQPTDYTHVATLHMRRLDLAWTGPEIKECDKMVAAAEKAGVELPKFVKKTVHERVEEEDS